MKIQIIILLIVLSFLAPSLHFIEHEHNYNPFTHKLEHKHNNISSKTHKSSSNTEIQELKNKKSEIDICHIKLNCEIYKKNYYSPFIKTKYKNQYIYSFNFSIKNIKNNKILFIAPKNSPPIA